MVRVPDVGVPRTGVTSVGEVANTAAPLPVSSVRAEARLALLGVARNVPTPVPSPLTPVLIGSPVQLVSVPDAGVPSAGVVSVGEVSVLFVSVCESVSPTTAPLGAVTLVSVFAPVLFSKPLDATPVIVSSAIDAPSAVLVPAIVTAEFVSDAFAIPLIVTTPVLASDMVAPLPETVCFA